jgi:hypothetical protein
MKDISLTDIYIAFTVYVSSFLTKELNPEKVIRVWMQLHFRASFNLDIIFGE